MARSPGQGSNNVGRFDAHTGELIDEIVFSGSGGLSAAMAPVAILATPAFDASSLPGDGIEWRNPTDLTLAAQPVRSANEDVDGDGDRDRIFFFPVPDLMTAGVVDCNSTAAAFVGRTLSDKLSRGRT